MYVYLHDLNINWSHIFDC